MAVLWFSRQQIVFSFSFLEGMTQMTFAETEEQRWIDSIAQGICESV